MPARRCGWCRRSRSPAAISSQSAVHRPSISVAAWATGASQHSGLVIAATACPAGVVRLQVAGAGCDFEVARARGFQRTADGKFGVSPIADLDWNQAPEPMKKAAPEQAKASPTSNTDAAHYFVQEGRNALNRGNLAKARECVAQAQALNVTFHWWEDNPGKLAVDIMQAAEKESHAHVKDKSSTPATVKDAVVGAALGDLGTAVTAAAAAGGFSRADSHLTRTQVKLDERAWKELDKELNASLKRVQKIADDAGKRLEVYDQVDTKITKETYDVLRERLLPQ